MNGLNFVYIIKYLYVNKVNIKLISRFFFVFKFLTEILKPFTVYSALGVIQPFFPLLVVIIPTRLSRVYPVGEMLCIFLGRYNTELDY